MSPALQRYALFFDAAFFELSPNAQKNIQEAIDMVGMDLNGWKHEKSADGVYFLIVGQYVIFYDFDSSKNILDLLEVLSIDEAGSRL